MVSMMSESKGAKKGYVFTVSTFFIFSSVIILALFFSTRIESPDVAATKLAAIYDDIRSDMVYLFSSEFSIVNEDNLTTLRIFDSMPTKTVPSKIRNYEYFLERNYSKEVGEYIEDRTASLAGADINLYLNNLSFWIWPHNYSYAYGDLNKSNFSFYPLPNSSNLLSYSLNLSLQDNVSTIIEDVDTGDLPFKLSVSYANLTTASEALVSLDGNSSWTILLDEGNISISFGEKSIGGRARNSTLFVTFNGNASAGMQSMMLFNQSRPLTVWSDIYTKLTDITYLTRLEKDIWFIKE